jgi:(E)-4-hydroxy-3-methylbut-2-enyl-diphosphate synthase
VEVDAGKASEGAEWLAKIEEENAGDLTPERIAAMEKEAAAKEAEAASLAKTVTLDEEASPTAGRRFTRA